MFWAGLIIAFLAGMIGIGLSRDWAKKRFPMIRDLHLDWAALLLLVIGLIISALDFSDQATIIKHLEDEQKGRVLSAGQKASLLEDLSRLPKSNVYLMGIQGDREAVRFANMLKEVFLSADWTVDGVWEDILVGGPGVLIRQNSPSKDSVGQLVTEALNRIHVQVRFVQRPDLEPLQIEIIVGSRP